MAVRSLMPARAVNASSHRNVVIGMTWAGIVLALVALVVWSVRIHQGIAVQPTAADLADVAPLADVRLSTLHPLVGEVIRIDATYTNPEPRAEDVRFRLFITREDYHLFGPIPPPLVTVGAHERERGGVRYLMTTPGLLGAQVVVTDTDLTKFAAQTFPAVDVTPASTPVVALALALDGLTIVGALAWLMPPLMRGTARRAAPTRRLRSFRIVAVLALVPLFVVALAPALHTTILAPMPMLAGFPVLLMLLPAVVFRVGMMLPVLWRVMLAGGVFGALFAVIAFGSLRAVIALTIACTGTALAGSAYHGRRLDRVFWAALVAVCALLIWAYLDGNTYMEQALALIVGALRG